MPMPDSNGTQSAPHACTAVTPASNATSVRTSAVSPEQEGAAPADRDAIVGVVQRYWGYSTLRPLQEQAIHASLWQRDSLVVLPTGGGKSLCYQVPPALLEATDVVVSPLISLMKDQVDGLRACGYAAAALYSGMAYPDVRAVEAQLLAGQLRLLFVAPERLLTPRFIELLQRTRVRAFAIDEAHCISHWGHDFRPEYRQLARLKDSFPTASLHAFTATATERVRADIVAQLGLRDPAVLVGGFDRPNLIYRIVPRIDAEDQALEVIRRRPGQAIIVYTISRKDAESMAAWLKQHGVRAAYYHAGMDAELRRKTQEQFASEDLDVIAATVAFGMGIDRSDVRCVIHAAMPKSIEHYQQETGRAGRDGLPAECILFYSAADAMRWESLLQRSAAESDSPEDTITPALELLSHMRRLCGSMRCRHRALSSYFGQELEAANCGACDVCLEEVDGLVDGTVTAQKVLSCVARTGERFGIEHICDVLLGAQSDRVRKWNHDQLSTYGLLKGTNRRDLNNVVYQLVDLGVLARTPGDRPVLQLNDLSWEVMRGRRPVQIKQVKESGLKTTVAEAESWEGIDRGLFDALRDLRRQIADERGVPAFVIFGDVTLRDMARARPASREAMLNVRGVGQKKLEDLGERFLDRMASYCAAHDLDLDVAAGTRPRRKAGARVSDAKRVAFEMFAAGKSFDEIGAAIDRRPGTLAEYLEEFLATNRPESIDPWVDRSIQAQVLEAARYAPEGRLKPIFQALGGRVPYEQIRFVIAWHGAA